MSLAKPLASLSSSLLARKGGARPAMRSQLPDSPHPVAFDTGEPISPEMLEDLGWNDLGLGHIDHDQLGEEEMPPRRALTKKPVVLQQIDALAAAIEQEPEKFMPQVRTKGGKLVRSALQEGRKAAFTLRIDNYRHLRLRLASTLQDRSAQAVVTEALDRFLADIPGLDELARRAQRD
ncbi:hypothetical protein OVA07_03060 [Novosphingobium sp. SL115]|uniref:hypothetical protein n=1 Tax=Novosphingobium sp. SL115 TaxID=2995150 RepID=UPI002274E233|nr:hypothetical protein [Novosphingobium sp. SL115]MCY1669986.1 hypothetical protein [Novosphingobium sp. SL115]